jgi:hypothetical protein
MKSKLTLSILLIGVLVLVACQAQPVTRVSGDAWEYALRKEDVPEGWTFEGQSLQTAYDLAISQPVTESLKDVQQLYSQRYVPPPSSEYAELDVDILLYNSTEEAQASLKADSLNEEWELISAATVGDESRVWRFKNTPETPNQGLYRVDFRYFNAIGSITLFGSSNVVPNPDEALAYAQKVLEKMKAGALPSGLARLQSANRPDVRSLLLSQEQLKTLDPVLGERWQVSAQQLGGWTENAAFGEEASSVLNRLGRLTGYQLYMAKALSTEERADSSGFILFQQISVYPNTDSADKGLQAMVGVQNVQEIVATTPVGDQTRWWHTTLVNKNSQETIALTEINFRVGNYVATVQLQSSPRPQTVDMTPVLIENEKVATELALQLAKNLSGK